MNPSLANVLKHLQITSLTGEAVPRLERYAELLRNAAAPRGFIGESTASDVETIHIGDSLAALPVLDGMLPSGDGRIVDVGAGAGLPGIPLKIARPAIEVMLVESSRRRCEFLLDVVGALGLQGVSVKNDRAEHVGQDAAWREHFDLATARAVLATAAALELTLPMVKIGGCALLYKTAGQAAEIEGGESAAEVLGGRLRELRGYTLPGLRQERVLAVFAKVAPTPARYPRRAGIPAKRPLA